MFGFGKKKKTESIDLEKEVSKLPSGAKELTMHMMAGQFDLNDMLVQLKHIKKITNFGGLLKLVPGMSGAVSVMKEKIKDGSLDAQIKILEAMTAEERAEPDKIFANAKARIAEKAGCTVRDVEHLIKQAQKMKQHLAMIQRMGGMEAAIQRMQNMKMPGDK